MNTLLLLLALNISSYNNDISTIRTLYLSAYTNESNCNYFGEKLMSIQDEKNVLIKGYKGCFYFIKCKFINNPISKYIYFNKGKELLESAIQTDPNSIELRFLRYTIQKNTPRFLLYYNNIEKDLKFVNENLNKTINKDIKNFILTSITSINKQ